MTFNTPLTFLLIYIYMLYIIIIVNISYILIFGTHKNLKSTRYFA